ncbi:aromatic-ring hydroxylase C-terminal domain-containing protein [Sinomonas terrae]|uniref:aromatic-ring hydroxylase C-terminal domain-containing protein n=1 Tax=Sinomonas terrae TaxID=2908838 RepID=UPI0035581004
METGAGRQRDVAGEPARYLSRRAPFGCRPRAAQHDDRVQRVDAEYRGRWEFPVLGTVTAPSAVLIRPDGYVAWVGVEPQEGHEGLHNALAKWFGTECPGLDGN